MTDGLQVPLSKNFNSTWQHNGTIKIATSVQNHTTAAENIEEVHTSAQYTVHITYTVNV